MRQDTLEAQNEAANASLRQLQSELQATRQQLTKLLDLVEKQQAQLTAHESSIARLDRILNELLTGRVWRTLSAAGKVAKRFLPGGSSEGSVALSRKRSYLVCDEPKPSDRTPRSGKIAVKGWCLAEGGVDSIQISVPG